MTNPPVPSLDVEACVRPDMPWRCFHCDEVFTTREAAAEHFGVDSLSRAGCVARVPDGERTLLAELRESQWNNRRLFRRAEEAEREAEEYAGLRAELKRYFGHADARSCWNVLDSMKGRALAAEEMIQRLLTAANAPAAEYLCDRVDALASALPGMGKDSERRFVQQPDAPPGPPEVFCRYCGKRPGRPTHKGTRANFCQCVQPAASEPPSAGPSPERASK